MVGMEAALAEDTSLMAHDRRSLAHRMWLKAPGCLPGLNHEFDAPVHVA